MVAARAKLVDLWRDIENQMPGLLKSLGIVLGKAGSNSLVRQRPFDISQSKHVGYIAGALDGKSKVWRRLGMPPAKALRPLQRVKRSI